MENIETMGNQLHILSMSLLNIFLESWSMRINLLLETFEIEEFLSFYPLSPMNLNNTYDIPLEIWGFLILFNVFIIISY